MTGHRYICYYNISVNSKKLIKYTNDNARAGTPSSNCIIVFSVVEQHANYIENYFPLN